MATDLELVQDLGEIKLPKLKIQPCGENGSVIQGESSKNKNEDDDDNKRSIISSDELCLTPTAEENKIPAVLSCPPAPRKPKRKPVSCKRKLSDQFDFFEIVNREEVDEFFRAAGFDDSFNKRRCPCK
ncbi:hypothetical protein CCACVL1_09170 [Corchorus capsularis]|uniref:Uncharacterized protein n=1 Tax=Corchorus capsularis TaxID=210143 RepID=A0A1R3IXD6_COCAP|nr:hypothetical protein CCACVL1_09170 [Corchorus capsularis]